MRITGPVKNHISEHHLFIYVSGHGLESATVVQFNFTKWRVIIGGPNRSLVLEENSM